MEWFVALLILLPAIWLALTHSSWLLDYAIVVLAFNRGIRRVIDYYFNGAFNPYSPISLTPLLVAGMLIVPAVMGFKRLSKKSRAPFLLLCAALIMGFAVGIVQNHLAAVYSLAEWLSSWGAMAFAATQAGSKEVSDRWIKTAGWSAVGVAGYGWWQYFTIPPWDGMWLVQSGMAGYMGQPEPTLMTVFSTMNERGPCGTFLAWAVIPMILNRRWRNAGGWVSIALILSGIFLTETRSNLIVIAIVLCLYPAIAKGKGVPGLLFASVLAVIGVNYGLSKLPNSEKMLSRFTAESLFGDDSSLAGRLEIYEYGLSDIARMPLGLGLGSSGMGKRAEKGTIQTVGDSGYLQIMAQFGWIGTLLFAGAIWLLWRELGVRWRINDRVFGHRQADPFVPLTRAILLCSLVFLFVGDIFAGFSLMWVFFGRALSPQADPILLLRRRLARERLPEILSLREQSESTLEST